MSIWVIKIKNRNYVRQPHYSYFKYNLWYFIRLMIKELTTDEWEKNFFSFAHIKITFMHLHHYVYSSLLTILLYFFLFFEKNNAYAVGQGHGEHLFWDIPKIIFSASFLLPKDNQVFKNIWLNQQSVKHP